MVRGRSGHRCSHRRLLSTLSFVNYIVRYTRHYHRRALGEMQIGKPAEIQRTELPEMFAPVCSNESLFGPNHPQTLNLAMQLGLALWRHGELDPARRVLEGCIRSVDWILGRDHDSRMQILNALRDILMLQGEAS